jgi:hypothetical protein
MNGYGCAVQLSNAVQSGATTAAAPQAALASAPVPLPSHAAPPGTRAATQYAAPASPADHHPLPRPPRSDLPPAHALLLLPVSLRGGVAGLRRGAGWWHRHRLCGRRRLRQECAAGWAEGKRHFFWSFPYVRPEPVLVKCSFLYINGSKMPFSSPLLRPTAHDRQTEAGTYAQSTVS